MCIKIQASWKPPHRKVLRTWAFKKPYIRFRCETMENMRRRVTDFKLLLLFHHLCNRMRKVFSDRHLAMKMRLWFRRIWKFIAKGKTKWTLKIEWIRVNFEKKKIPIETKKMAQLQQKWRRSRNAKNYTTFIYMCELCAQSIINISMLNSCPKPAHAKSETREERFNSQTQPTDKSIWATIKV